MASRFNLDDLLKLGKQPFYDSSSQSPAVLDQCFYTVHLYLYSIFFSSKTLVLRLFGVTQIIGGGCSTTQSKGNNVPMPSVMWQPPQLCYLDLPQQNCWYKSEQLSVTPGCSGGVCVLASGLPSRSYPPSRSSLATDLPMVCNSTTFLCPDPPLLRQPTTLTHSLKDLPGPCANISIASLDPAGTGQRTSFCQHGLLLSHHSCDTPGAA